MVTTNHSTKWPDLNSKYIWRAGGHVDNGTLWTLSEHKSLEEVLLEQTPKYSVSPVLCLVIYNECPRQLLQDFS